MSSKHSSLHDEDEPDIVRNGVDVDLSEFCSPALAAD